MQADFDLSQLNDIPDVVEPVASEAPQASELRPGSYVRGATRSDLLIKRVIALALTVLWFAFQIATLGLRKDFAQIGLRYSLVQIGLPLVFSSVLLGLALRPGRGSLGARASVLTGSVLVAIFGMTAVISFYPLPFAYVPPPGSMTFGQWVVVCGDIVAIMGVLPLVFAAFAFRHTFAAAARERAAVLGGACAMGAVAAMHLHCENIDPLHSVLGHMVPAAALAAASTWVLARVTRS